MTGPSTRRLGSPRRRLLPIVAAIVAAVSAMLASGSYTIRPGDTLSGIAASHGTSVRALQEANGIRNPHLVIAGKKLTVPGAKVGSTKSASSTYTVRRGDTLSGIAASHGTSVRALQEANGIRNPHLVRIGARIRVPGSGSAAPASLAAAKTSTTHTVVRGETLSSIANRFGATVKELARANGIANPNLVRIGHRLVIPSVSSHSASLPSRLRQNPARLALLPVFDRWADTYGVPRDLLKAMTWTESGWQSHVVSHTGAVGIGQLMPATVEFVSQILLRTRLDPRDPHDNIRMSARYLKWLLDKAGGDTDLALAGYYQGFRAVTERGVYTVTRQYIATVTALRARF